MLVPESELPAELLVSFPSESDVDPGLLSPGPPTEPGSVPLSDVSPLDSVFVPSESEVVVPKDEQLDAQSAVQA